MLKERLHFLAAQGPLEGGVGDSDPSPAAHPDGHALKKTNIDCVMCLSLIAFVLFLIPFCSSVQAEGQ